MDKSKAITIIKIIASGTDPLLTGEIFLLIALTIRLM